MHWNGKEIPKELGALPVGTYVVESVDHGRAMHWNGKEIPEELRALPVGTYVVEVDRVPLLTAEEEAGLNAALDSLQAGQVRSLAQVHETIAAILARPSSSKPG